MKIGFFGFKWWIKLFHNLKNIFLLVLLIFLLLILVISIFFTHNNKVTKVSLAATIIVSPGQSISNAVNSANPGDTIQIRAGTYSGNVSVSRSGTVSAPIKIMGYPGERPIINGGGASDVFDFGSSQYVVLSNVRIEDGDQLIRMRTNNVVVDNVEFYINGSRGVDCRGHGNKIINSYFDTDRTSTAQNDGIWSTGGGGHVFSNNYMINRNSNGSAHSDNIQLYQETEGSIISNNFLWQDNTKTTNAQGIYIEDSDTGTYKIFNNVIYFPYAKNGVAIRNSQLDAYIIGNTFYQTNAVSANLWIRDDSASSLNNIIIKNNIFYSGSGSNYSMQIEETLGPGSDVGGNLFYAPNQSNPLYYLGAKSLTAWNNLSFVGNDYEANPQFINPGNKDLSLSSNSPAINKGLPLGSPYNVDKDGKIRPQGSGWDIGAYEYGSGSIYTPTTTTLPTSPTAKPGDVNRDGVVNIIDFQLLSNSFGKSSGQMGFNVNADLNKDNVVNILDFQILSNNFGK